MAYPGFRQVEQNYILPLSFIPFSFPFTPSSVSFLLLKVPFLRGTGAEADFQCERSPGVFLSLIFF